MDDTLCASGPSTSYPSPPVGTNLTEEGFTFFDPWEPLSSRIGLTLLNAVLFLAGFLGNILVILIIIMGKNLLRSPTNVFLLSLAFAELLQSLLTCPLMVGILLRLKRSFRSTSRMAVRVSTRRCLMPLGDVSCRLHVFLSASAYDIIAPLLAALAYIRYAVVTDPLSALKSHTTRRATISVIVIVFCVVALNAPLPFLHHAREEDGLCMRIDMLSPVPRIVGVIKFFAFFFVPLLTILILYALMINHLKNDPNAIASASSRQGPRASRKMISTIIAVVIVFTVSSLPSRSLAVFGAFFPTVVVPSWIFSLGATLASVNAAFDPVLLNMLSRRFRAAAKQLWQNRSFCRSAQPQ